MSLDPDFAMFSTDEDPAITLNWQERGAALDLSSATLVVKLINGAGAVALTSAGTTTGYASLQGTAPYQYNLLHSFAAGELANLSGFYKVWVQATISSRQRTYRKKDLPVLWVEAVPA